ncbi:hypothetical protein GCM10010512_22990 [Streptomyces thermoviolaceus subsp. thermoviolaceus]|nr:hypothetical protein GCM10010512_22990 [Streptomyces thermoviolaceus subsp. thermoviolaceus]
MVAVRRGAGLVHGVSPAGPVWFGHSGGATRSATSRTVTNRPGRAGTATPPVSSLLADTGHVGLLRMLRVERRAGTARVGNEPFVRLCGATGAPAGAVRRLSERSGTAARAGRSVVAAEAPYDVVPDEPRFHGPSAVGSGAPPHRSAVVDTTGPRAHTPAVGAEGTGRAAGLRSWPGSRASHHGAPGRRRRQDAASQRS